MSQNFHITLAQLTTWNPILGYPDGHNCTTQFWAGYDYCVGVSGSPTSSSTTSSESSVSTSSLPYPTQSGITSACSKYVEAKAGDYCFIFAQNNNITTNELYNWNTILGANGANCSTEFQAGYDYCVSTILDLEKSLRRLTSSDDSGRRVFDIRNDNEHAPSYLIYRYSLGDTHPERSRKQLQ